ncbi:heparan-alpha-glucosaminide N-acetyltransferase-like isoform X1 [Juglans microcarpa x Juglans regia]|uniref:heparan-alpha-glucosaminide N-acetyltransferase-like isoform X1 n=2 Tax=Juglans microcarpa x Juglans regia TaxID=2249226 RepID=UPI001B7E2C6E|nr:heparan-alpha-glucosaminide N-acetyltransferase-like isoform X1 [Juglans microcarpa x Juglans regia]XP_041010184.1 heparan-alpha-glucosaminide N-acetyltransferase-like isoform X1 [Juglans microcarpa x Juglans regia]XP_041010185.1 heparan-alpha-glucosaminide N-acetyltransferase-like isoform X1 [Juglans microcarpa x Juglans regia]
MADYEPLRDVEEQLQTNRRATRVASLDVFRGLCVFLMMLVDYGGSVFPVISHSPWDGIHLADFVMPFFLFIAGLSPALAYKKVPNRAEATWKAVLRAVKLFLLGVLLQGGYLHGVNSLTYGVDIEKIRWMGVLQRISIGYIVAALCEIWLTCRTWRQGGFFKSYFWHWCIAFSLSAVYMLLLYGLYVPNWQFTAPALASSLSPSNDSNVYMVRCAVRGDLGPACNSAGMIDRYILGVDHLYMKPAYRNLKECKISDGQECSPPWCDAPFDPEGILSSLTAAVTCIFGLQYGHILADLQDHKGRLTKWSLLSISSFILGLLLAFTGIPVNKSLYTVSYMLITSASAGITFCALYLLVDVYGYRRLTSVLEWMGMHSLSIFVLITSNLAIIAIQGFYWTAPENNVVHWIISRFVHA